MLKKKTEISERILQLIDYLKVSKNEFARNLGYERSQAIYDVVNGKSKPSFYFFNRLYNSKYSGFIDPEWLLTGRGTMLREGFSTPDNPPAPQPPAEQASPIKIPSSQSDARQLAIHVLDHVKELEQQPIFMSYIKQKAYEIALDIVTEKLSK